MVLRLILGDQLNRHHSWYEEKSDNVIYCLFEMRQETDYVKHHIKKVAAFFLAMRNFAEELKSAGHRVIYYTINDSENEQNLQANLLKLIEEFNVTRFEYQLPDEYRLDEQLKSIASSLGVDTEVFDTEHFLTERGEVADFFGDSQYLMERFYRYMRKKHNVLMDDDRPLGGTWNYDKENRKKLARNHEKVQHLAFRRDIKGVLKEIEEAEIQTIGNADDGDLPWPISRKESLEVLDFFTDHLLPNFGTFQDAMTENDPYVYHSLLSFSLNTKLISPLEVVRKVEKAYIEDDRVDIAQTEGYIRQILGWREYVRGVYWAKMPEYAGKNFFGNERKLPDWYWTGETKMNCLKNAISQSLNLAYAHHIQRLMITGNFALLAGCDPDEVDKWYLGIYIDAIEWVEITNTRGMSQFADGGLLATKPYVSSANYVHKMSDYCSNCKYDRKKRTGSDACPFNSLYWNFLSVKRELLENNRRMSMMYRLLDKISDEEKQAIDKRAEYLLANIDSI